MFRSGILETAIGVVFVFLLVSMLVTIINELIASVLLSRAKWLRIGIERLLESEWAKKLYDHPLIDGTAASAGSGTAGANPVRGSGPSYIPSRSFANVLLDLLREHSDSASVASIQLRLRAALHDVPGEGSPFGRLKDEIAAVKTEFPGSRLATAIAADLERFLPRLQARMAALPNTAATDGAVQRLPAPYTVRDAATDLQRFIDAMPVRYVREMIAGMPNARISKTLLVLLDDAQGDFEKFKQNIEVWFNNAMDRVGGWYKRRSQYVMLAISLAAAVCLNVDSVLVAKHLQAYPGVRDALVAQARTFAASAPPRLGGSTSAGSDGQDAATAPSQPVIANAALPPGAGTDAKSDTSADLPDQFASVEAQLNQLSLPIGWVRQASSKAELDARLALPGSPGEWEDTIKFHLLGWLITALAATLGAPFWFDTLNRIMSIRSAGKAPEEMPKPPKEVPLPLEPGQSPEDAAFHVHH
jgi:hypothetical protein